MEESDPMGKIAVLTDSVACIPPEMIDALNIRWVAYYLHRGQEVLRDLVTIQCDEFVKYMLTARSIPTTASPGPGDYYREYEQLAEQGVDQIVSLHITSKASGAYQAAKVAQEMAAERLNGVRIEVIDTVNAAMCQGWLVIEAARAVISGCSMDDILERIRRMLPVTKMVLTADTLKYLYMGGRIGKAEHLVGSMLNIKPLIGLKDGVISPLGVERSRQRAYATMARLVEKAVGPGGLVKVAYVHVGAREEVEKLREQVEARVKCVEVIFSELSPALMVHSGPGTTGVCYLPAEV
jgi:DegV family protein with EDD domain